MIYEDLKIYIGLNIILNYIWQPIFQQATPLAFGFSVLIIIGLFITNFKIFTAIQPYRNDLNIWEFILLRFGYTIYLGWITTATIVIKIYSLKKIILEKLLIIY